MADKSKTVIVKKIRRGHEGGHGGSWKVAYADFVTAMMAFFLLMWLLAMVTPQKRASMAEYFKNFSIFEKSGKSFMQESSQILSKPGGEAQTVSQESAKAFAEDFQNKLKKAIDEKLQGLKEHVMIDAVPEGVRIQVVDTEGKPMFLPGGAELSSSAKEILGFVADNIKDMPNKIAVEGHTDSSPLKREKYTNWELSTERASTARRNLEQNSVDSGRIARVVGYADTQLLYKDSPTDSRNRRISIIVLNERVPRPPMTVQPAETKAPAPAAEKPAAGQEQKKSLFGPLNVAPRNPLEFTKPIEMPAKQ